MLRDMCRGMLWAMFRKGCNKACNVSCSARGTRIATRARDGQERCERQAWHAAREYAKQRQNMLRPPTADKGMQQGTLPARCSQGRLPWSNGTCSTSPLLLASPPMPAAPRISDVKECAQLAAGGHRSSGGEHPTPAAPRLQPRSTPCLRTTFVGDPALSFGQTRRKEADKYRQRQRETD